MTRGRGKNAPDRSAELAERDAEAMPDVVRMMVGGALPEQGRMLMESIAASGTAMRIIKPEDLPLLEQYCMFWQVYCDARDAYTSLPAESRTREETMGGYKRNSDIDTMRHASDQMQKLAKQMGLTPVARAQLSLTNAASASLMATSFPDRVRAMFEAANGK